MILTLQHKLQIPNSNEFEACHCFFRQRPLWFLKMQQTKSVFMYLKGVLKFFSCMEQICDIKNQRTKIFIEV
jgi:hypothetical protein